MRKRKTWSALRINGACADGGKPGGPIKLVGNILIPFVMQDGVLLMQQNMLRQVVRFSKARAASQQCGAAYREKSSRISKSLRSPS